MKYIGFNLSCAMAIGSMLLFASCRREQPTTWNTDVLLPLAFGRISLDDLVADSLLQLGDNNLYHLVLHENFTDFDLDSLVAIPDTIIENVVGFGFTGGPFTIPNNTTLFNETDNNLIKLNDVELRELDMKSGLLRFKIKSFVNGYMDCTYSLPGVTLNGVPVMIHTITQPSVGETPFIYSGEIDLSNYHIDMTGSTGLMYNRVESITVIKTAANAPVPAVLQGDDYVAIEMEFLNVKVHYAKGYFGQHTYQLNQMVDFSESFKLPLGLLNLDETTMDLNIINSVGADLSLDFTQIRSFNSAYNHFVTLQHTPIYQPINIERAYDNNGSVASHQYHFHLNNANSNITPFIENLPDKLQLAASVEVNPLGDNTDGNDFIYTDNTLHGTFELNIPLNISMQALTLRDTLEIKQQVELTADGKIYVYANNAFPFDATITASIVDEYGEQLIPLIQTQTINHAALSGEPGVTIPSESVIVLDASQDVINNLQQGNRIALMVALDTPGYPTTTGLYQNYFLDFKIVANGRVLLSVN